MLKIRIIVNDLFSVKDRDSMFKKNCSVLFYIFNLMNKGKGRVVLSLFVYFCSLINLKNMTKQEIIAVLSDIFSTLTPVKVAGAFSLSKPCVAVVFCMLFEIGIIFARILIPEKASRMRSAMQKLPSNLTCQR